jgi:putative ABC transport system permease protein
MIPVSRNRKPETISNLNQKPMLLNYLTIAFRNLMRKKIFSLINILGLAVAMAFSVLIFLWVADEVNHDQFHSNGNRLYRVLQTYVHEESISCSDKTTALLARALKEEMPEVELATMMTSPDQWTFKVKDKITREQGSYASEDFFSMFSFPLVKGDPKNCLSTTDQIVISQKIASDYFGNADPMGQPIHIDNRKDFFVSGVFADVPKNSSLQFDFILPYKDYLNAPWANDWGAVGDKVFVQLKENATAKNLGLKLKNFLKTKIANTKDQLSLQPFPEIYLHSNFKNGVQDGGRIGYARLFSVVAILILLVACVNFMNLATAQSVKRSKEVGIRKVIGAGRAQLMGQFMGEAILTALLSLVIALFLVELLLPTFNILTEKQLWLSYTEPTFVLLLIGLAIVTGFISGSYPALFLSSLRPAKILKGTLKFNSSAIGFRKALVIFQFSLSIIFILGTIVVYQQMQFIQNKNLGVDRENLIYQIFEGGLIGKLPAFKTELLQSPGIQSVTYSNQPIFNVQHTSTWIEWPGKNKEVAFAQVGVSYDYLKTMKIALSEGRDFSPAFISDSSNVIVNEEAVRQMGITNPIGYEITNRRDMVRKGKIIGVVKNFHLQSLHAPIEPLCIFLDTYPTWGFVSVRTEPGKTKDALASMVSANKKFNPEFPFAYAFADEEFRKQYAAESLVENLTKGFSFLTIFISCLGLFGLAMFSAEQRTKEIGIRKILGASVAGIVQLLSKDFIKLILLSFVMACPVAWWALNNWLQDFAYRTEITWWVFGVAGLVAAVIALVTVGSHAVKAAMGNPVESLRSE